MLSDPATLYLELLKRTLTRYDLGDLRYTTGSNQSARSRAVRFVNARLQGRGVEVNRIRPFDPDARHEGRDQPFAAETMVGIRRLSNIEYCIRTVIQDNIPGDLLEAGVWRGGAIIFMRAVLEALGDETRVVWAADSFRGLPRPDPSVWADRGDKHHQNVTLSASLEDVRNNISKYSLLDDRVRFLEGWFSDTLSEAPLDLLAVLRVDGDMYKSTADVLVPLYPKVADGGFVIIDDYGAVQGCRAATDDYRTAHSVVDEMIRIDWTGVYWRKGSGPKVDPAKPAKMNAAV